jgi:hypothetical protein
MEKAKSTIAGDNRTSIGPIDVNVLSDIIGEAFLIVFIGD